MDFDNHFNKFNLDIRKEDNQFARFVDQKCTPDVLSFITDCIVNWIDSKGKDNFTTKDIWMYEYFSKSTVLIFGKPSTKNENASNEYDKFIGQPLNLLAYARILKKEKNGKGHLYTIINKDLLIYISLKDKNAFNFLYHYFTKVLKDSSFISHIDTFIEKNDKVSFDTLKVQFQKFMIGNTNIGSKGSPGTTEVNRIFSKVINIFSVFHNKKGTRRGYISLDNITYSELMYNQINFRDIGKDKSTTRKEHENEDTDIGYNTNLIERAKNYIKKLHPYSEVKDNLWEKTNHIHHIFPQSKYPEIASYLENLIALTSGQHLQKAHPNGNTHLVARDYQLVCLYTKSETIEQSIKNGNFYYKKESFIHVINTGLKSYIEISNEVSFEEIRNKLNTAYRDSIL